MIDLLKEKKKEVLARIKKERITKVTERMDTGTRNTKKRIKTENVKKEKKKKIKM